MIDITHEQQPLGYGDVKNRYGKRRRWAKREGWIDGWGEF
jgi:hypothetical protein